MTTLRGPCGAFNQDRAVVGTPGSLKSQIMTFYNKRFKRTYAKKKVYKKKARSNLRWKSQISAGVGFPKRMTFTHKYHEQIIHTSTAGVITFYKYVCNGLFDPNSSGAGHQPYYFDQMSAIYNHYCVIGSKINIKAMPTTSSTAGYYITLAQNDDTVITNNTIDGMAEQGGGNVRMVPASSMDRVVSLTNKWSCKKTFGGSVLADDFLRGTAAANPTEVTIWCIGLQAADLSSTVAVEIEVSIEYITVWSEVKDVAQS